MTSSRAKAPRLRTNTYPYRSMLETLLSYGEDAKKPGIKERALSGIKRTVGDIVSQSPFNIGQDNAAKRSKPQQTTAKSATKKKKKKKVTVKPGKRRNDIFG